jgi:hypothetical protein
MVKHKEQYRERQFLPALGGCKTPPASGAYSTTVTWHSYGFIMFLRPV